MEVIRGHHQLLPHHHGCVLTIGNFDGVHRGHQQIIERLRHHAERLNCPAVLVTFEPLPQEYFRADADQEQALPRLTRLREKLLLLKRHAIDRVLILRFNQTLARLSAEQFVKQILVDRLGVRYLLEGDDFHFGRERSGDIALLTNLGKQFNFEVEQLALQQFQGQRISSSNVRQALSVGNLEQANHLLGYPYGIHGRVVHGEKLGRQWGVPTANILLQRGKSPLLGIYAVRLNGIHKTPIKGVASIGFRPTVSHDDKALLEVHLFDFNQDIYGRNVHVEFLKKFRDEQKFDSIEELKQQIFRDITWAKQYFS